MGVGGRCVVCGVVCGVVWNVPCGVVWCATVVCVCVCVCMFVSVCERVSMWRVYVLCAYGFESGATSPSR